MIDKECCEESLNVNELLNHITYNIQFRINNPTFFDADGLVIFVGPQGSGKTLSAVNYVYKLMEKYPKCKLCTNLLLKKYPIVTFDEFIENTYTKLLYSAYKNNELSDDIIKKLRKEYILANRVFSFDNADDLEQYFNDTEGVIYLIDEIHLYFNSLESKNINPDTMVQFSQQRKQRKHIVATSQVFGRMAKPLREQFSNVIVCEHKLFKTLQHNQLVDRDAIDDSQNDMKINGKVQKHYWYWRSPKMFERYDTYYTISRTKFISNELKKGDLYGSNGTTN